MRYDASRCSGYCKTCKAPVEPGAVRCEAHEQEFQRWLADDAEAGRSAYKPRLNGVSDWDRTCAPGFKFRRRGRSPLPGEDLKFD